MGFHTPPPAVVGGIGGTEEKENINLTLGLGSNRILRKE